MRPPRAKRKATASINVPIYLWCWPKSICSLVSYYALHYALHFQIKKKKGSISVLLNNEDEHFLKSHSER